MPLRQHPGTAFLCCNATAPKSHAARSLSGRYLQAILWIIFAFSEVNGPQANDPVGYLLDGHGPEQARKTQPERDMC